MDINKLNKYIFLSDVDSWFNYQHKGLESIYITPEGNIFDLRRITNISHENFVKLFYKNAGGIQQKAREIEEFTSTTGLLKLSGTDSSEVIKALEEMVKPIKATNKNRYNYIFISELGHDTAIVHDLGFVRITSAYLFEPSVDLPMETFGHKMTEKQENALYLILTHILSHIDKNYDVDEFISEKKHQTKILNSYLQNSLVEESTDEKQ